MATVAAPDCICTCPVVLLITWCTDHDGCVNAFACQGINVSCSIADNHKVVIKRCSQSLTPKAKTGSLHALYLGIGAQRLADERIVLDCALMQPLEVTLLYVCELKSKTASQLCSWTDALAINMTDGCHQMNNSKPCRGSATSPSTDTRCCSSTSMFCRQLLPEVMLPRLSDSVA